MPSDLNQYSDLPSGVWDLVISGAGRIVQIWWYAEPCGPFTRPFGCPQFGA